MTAEATMDEIMTEKLIRIEAKIDRMCAFIEGDPSDENKVGLRVRMDRLEQASKLRGKIMGWFAATISALIGETAYRFFHKP